MLKSKKNAFRNGEAPESYCNFWKDEQVNRLISEILDELQPGWHIDPPETISGVITHKRMS